MHGSAYKILLPFNKPSGRLFNLGGKMFKNKLWLLVGAGLVATSAMTAGPAHAEVCVENSAGLTEQQLSVAFTTSKDVHQQSSIEWYRLANGEQYCQGSDSTPLYLALDIQPLMSDPARYTATKTFYFSKQSFRIPQNAGMGFAVQINENWTPKVTAGDGGKPKRVSMVQ